MKQKNLNRLITSKDIQSVNKQTNKQKNPTHTNPGSEGFTGEFYQTFK